MNRKIVHTLLISFTLFIVYNTLLPFKFHYGLSEIAKPLSQVIWFPYSDSTIHLSLTDIVGNILLFIPFGYFLYMSLYFIPIRRPIILTVFFSFFLSFFIEFVQLFIAQRNSAVHDLVNNVLGGLLGAVLASFSVVSFTIKVKTFFLDLLSRKPFFFILLAIAALQFLGAMLPFTVSITFSDLVGSVKDMNFFPFAYHSLGNIFLNSPNIHDANPFDYLKFVEDMIFWIGVGYILMLVYRIYFKEKERAQFIMWAGILFYFPLLEFTQIFIISRIFDINDIFSGYLGIGLGIAFYFLFRKYRRRTFHHHIDLFKIPLVFYFCFLIFTSLQPFHWHTSFSKAVEDVELIRAIPFYSYFKKTSLWNIADLVNSTLYFLPLSLYMTRKMRMKDIPWKSIYIKTTMLGLLMGGAIEITQIFEVIRVPDITDALAFGGGGALGTFILYYYEYEIKPKFALYDL